MNSNYSYIYDELLKLDVNISYEDIPNPRYLQEKIIQCNRFIAKTERFSIEINRALSTSEKAYKTEKLNLEMLRRNTLTNDIVIQKFPTGKEREAAVDEKLENNYKELLKLENTVNDLKAIQSSIKLKITTLRLANTDIKQLMKLMDQQINRLNIGHPDDPDMKDLTNTYKEIDDLEKEIEKTVENSGNPQTIEDELSISQLDSQESVKPADHVETDLQVVVEETDHAGEPIVLEDESDYDPNKEVDHKSDSQLTGVGESYFPETDVSVGDDIPGLATSISSKRLDARQDTDDLESGLASFLTDDVTNEIEPEEDINREEEGEISAEESTEGADFAAGEKSERVPDIDVEKSEDNSDNDKVLDNDDYQAGKITDLDLDITNIDLGETGISKNKTDIPESNLSMLDIGETGLSDIPDDKPEITVSSINSRELELPKIDIDLGDVGIDLGMDVEVPDVSDDTSKVTENPSVTSSTNKKEFSKEKKEKKEETQISNEKSEESELDFDLEDILNSFD
jgi:hypothetical protein